MLILNHNRVFHEEQDSGEPSFSGFIAKASASPSATAEEPPPKIETPPDKTKAGGLDQPPQGDSEKDKNTDESQSRQSPSLLEAAKLLTGNTDNRTDRQKADKKHDTDPDLADIYEEIGEAPGSDAGTGAQFDYVKKARLAFENRLKQARAELKVLKAGSGKSESEKAAIEQAKREVEAIRTEAERLATEKAALQKELAVYDIRHDPEFKEKYMEPIRQAEASILSTISTAADPSNQDAFRRDAIRVLSITDENDFRRQATALALELPNVLDQTQFRNEMIALRKLYMDQRSALENLDKLKPDLAKTREARNEYHANEFLTRGIEEANMRLAEHDPIVMVMRQAPVQAILEQHSDSLKAMDLRIDAIIKADIRERGKPPAETQQLYALARQRSRERVLLGAFMADYQALQEEHQKLVRQYQRATGRPWAESGPSRERASSDEVDSFAELAKRRMAET